MKVNYNQWLSCCLCWWRMKDDWTLIVERMLKCRTTRVAKKMKEFEQCCIIDDADPTEVQLTGVACSHIKMWTIALSCFIMSDVVWFWEFRVKNLPSQIMSQSFNGSQRKWISWNRGQQSLLTRGESGNSNLRLIIRNMMDKSRLILSRSVLVVLSYKVPQKNRILPQKHHAFGREVNWSRSLMVVGLFDRKLIWSWGLLVASIWSRVLVRGSFSRMSFGRRIIWSRGHLDARSFSCVVNKSHGYLVVGHSVALKEKSILTYLQK
jgi:hypothetical protein